MQKKLLVLALCLCFVLVGCEKKDDIAVDPAVPAATGGITNLTIWTTEGADFLTALGREYTASLGTNNLRFKVVTFADDQELKTFLVDRMAAGAGPDIIYTDGSWVARNAEKLTPATTTEGFNAAGFRNTFVQSAQSLLLKDDTILGIPMGVDSLGIYYNDAHIQDRLPSSNIPGRTWETFQEDVVSLTKTDNSFARFAFSGAALGRLDNVTHGFEILENIFLQSNVNWFNPEGTQAVFDNTQGLVNGRNENLGEQALDFYTSFADDRFKHHTWNEFVASPNQTYADFDAFLQGKVSMVFGYSRDHDRLKSMRADLQAKRQTVIPENDIRVTFFPQMNDPSVSPTKVLSARLHTLAVSRHSEFADVAWGFLKFAAEKDNLQSWFDATKLPSPRVDLLVEQEATPYVGIFVRQAKFADSTPLVLERAEVETALDSVIGNVESQKWTITQALQKAASTLNIRLNSYLQKLKQIAA